MPSTDKKRINQLLGEQVIIEPYNPAWPDMFEAERDHLRQVLPSDIVGRIEHFGSTAVPGMKAKPVVDILVEVSDLVATRRKILPILLDLEYDYLWRPTHGDSGPPWYAWFIKRDPATAVRTHHIHMVEPHFEHWERLAFCEFLRTHPDVAGQYELLKESLSEKYPRDRAAYTEGKTEFVSRITAEALKHV